MLPQLNAPFVQTAYVEKHLNANPSAGSGTPLVEYFTPWQFGTGADTIRCIQKMQNASSNFACAIYIQTANVRVDNPNAPVAITSFPIGNNETCTGDISITSYTGGSTGAHWFRLGIGYYNTNATGNAVADVAMQASWFCYGQQAGRKTFRIDANDTSNRFETLTGFLPIRHAQKAKLAIIANSITGTNNLSLQIVKRYALAVEAKPGSWNTITGASQTLTPGSTAVEWNTGELSEADNTNMYVQYGLQWALASGTTITSAIIDALVAVRGS